MHRCEICGDKSATNKVDFDDFHAFSEWYECDVCYQLIEESGEKEEVEVQKEEDG